MTLKTEHWEWDLWCVGCISFLYISVCNNSMSVCRARKLSGTAVDWSRSHKSN